MPPSWARWCLKSPAYRLFAQPLGQTQIKENIKLRVTGLCEGNPPVTGGFPSQRASNMEYISICRRHHEKPGRNVSNFVVIIMPADDRGRTLKWQPILSHKAHNALDKYATMHYFVTEMCTQWYNVGYGIVKFWDFCVTGLFYVPRGDIWTKKLQMYVPYHTISQCITAQVYDLTCGWIYACIQHTHIYISSVG